MSDTKTQPTAYKSGDRTPEKGTFVYYSKSKRRDGSYAVALVGDPKAKDPKKRLWKIVGSYTPRSTAKAKTRKPTANTAARRRRRCPTGTHRVCVKTQVKKGVAKKRTAKKPLAKKPKKKIGGGGYGSGSGSDSDSEYSMY